jgi:hypothetical protein
MADEWQQTWRDLGDEILAARVADVAEFMAAPADSAIGAGPAVSPTLSRQQRASAGIPLSSGDRDKIILVALRAISRANIKHIGPHSSDGSIIFGEHITADNIHQLDMRTHPAPAENPAAVTSLFPASKENPHLVKAKCILAGMDRWGDVLCVLGGYDNPTNGDVLSTWVEDPQGTFTRGGTPDPIPSNWLDGVSAEHGGQVVVGSKLLVYDGRPNVDHMTWWKCGLYDVISPGWHLDGGGNPVSDNAVIRRCSDADASSDFTFGKPVRVTSGTNFANHTFRYAGIDSPSVGISQLPFYDADTASIYASGYYGFGTGKVWQPVDGISTYHRNATAVGGSGIPAPAAKGIAADGSATIPIAIGDVVLVWCAPDTYSESPYFGPYKLIATNPDGTSPTLARIMEANEGPELSSLIVQITGAGAWHNGSVFTQTATINDVDVDATSWNVGTTVPVGEEMLLTAAQLGAQEVATTPQTASKTLANSTGQFNGFPTLVGTVPAITLPIGTVWTIYWESAWLSWPRSGHSFLQWTVFRSGSSPDDLFTVETPEITALSPGIGGAIQYRQTAEITFVLGDRVVLLPGHRNEGNAAGEVSTLNLSYGSPWTTRIEVPFDLPVGGAQVPHEHPIYQIIPEPMHDATIVGGLIVMPAGPNGRKLTSARVRSTGTINGIDPTGFVAGADVHIFFDQDSSTQLTLVAGVVGLPTDARFFLNSGATSMAIKAPRKHVFTLDTWNHGWRQQ